VNRRNAVYSLLAFGATPLFSLAQAQSKVWRIGFLAMRSRSTQSNPDVYYDQFVLGMRELGYVEGRNLIMEWRFADGKSERLPALAAELAGLTVDVIVTAGTTATQAAQRATSSIPIVTASVNDPVGSGFAANLARPGRNITGLSVMTMDVSPKQIDMLKAMVPELSRIAALVNPDNATHPAVLKGIQAAASKARIGVLPVEARTPGDIERGFAIMVRERVGAAIIVNDSFFTGQRQQMATLALKYRMPAIFPYRENVTAGGLMSYGQNNAEFYRRSATYVDKILKGAKPGELPIEQPMIFHMAINRETAGRLGLIIPSELLLRADEVIE